MNENEDQDIRSAERKRLAKLLDWMQDDSDDDAAQNEPGDVVPEGGASEGSSADQ